MTDKQYHAEVERAMKDLGVTNWSPHINAILDKVSTETLQYIIDKQRTVSWVPHWLETAKNLYAERILLTGE